MQAKSERFELRFEQNWLDRLDVWRAGEHDRPTRAEAVRRLMEIGFRHHDDQINFSDGEKLNFMMLRDIHRSLKIKNAEVDPDFVAAAIYGGHYWALRWQFSGLFHNERDSDQAVREVVNFLDMWSFLEAAVEKMGKADLEAIKKADVPFAEHIKFPGFDGNNEAGHLGITRFMIEKLDRFTKFKGRELNSHWPALSGYRQMYAVFDPIRPTLIGKELSGAQVIEIMSALKS